METIPSEYLILCDKQNSHKLMDKLKELNVDVHICTSFSTSEAISIKNVSDEIFSQIKDLEIVEMWDKCARSTLSF